MRGAPPAARRPPLPAARGRASRHGRRAHRFSSVASSFSSVSRDRGDSPQGEVFLASDWNLEDGCECSGGAKLGGVEYHHVSSVTAGSTANIVVASRELSTIWSLAHDGSGVQWTLSSQLQSDFQFERPADAFFQPHDVTQARGARRRWRAARRRAFLIPSRTRARPQLANGNLLVMDDGSNRPGCYLGVGANCFSRAVMYTLDPACDDVDDFDADDAHAGEDDDSGAKVTETTTTESTEMTTATDATTGPAADVACNRTAHIAWQFEFPLSVGRSEWHDVMADDVYNFCGGAISKLPSGNYLIAFTGMSKAASEFNRTTPRTAYAWEVDADGRAPPAAAGGDDDDVPGAEVRTTLRFPIPHADAASQNAYRVIPWASVAGESTSKPW